MCWEIGEGGRVASVEALLCEMQCYLERTLFADLPPNLVCLLLESVLSSVEPAQKMDGLPLTESYHIHVNGLATLYVIYKKFRHPPYGHVIKFPTGRTVLSPEVDESTIQLPSLLLVVGAVSPLEV